MTFGLFVYKAVGIMKSLGRSDGHLPLELRTTTQCSSMKDEIDRSLTPAREARLWGYCDILGKRSEEEQRVVYAMRNERVGIAH